MIAIKTMKFCCYFSFFFLSLVTGSPIRLGNVIKNVFGINIRRPLIEHYKCNNTYLPKNTKINCDCSDDCMKFGNCCFDKYWNPFLNAKAYLQKLINEKKKYNKQLTCRKAFDVSLHESQTYYMVTTCLNGSIVNFSSDLKDSIPVLARNGYLYMNEKCAKCNFIESYVHVNITAKCASIKSSHEYEGFATKDTFKNFEKCFFDILMNNYRAINVNHSHFVHVRMKRCTSFAILMMHQ